MKKLITALLAVTLLGASASAQFPGFPGFRMRGPADTDAKYTLQAGDVTMVVDATFGGRILSFKYKDTEILSQTTAPNSFGSTFWTSPQKVWNWPPVPEYDTNEYTVEDNGTSIVMTGSKSEKYGYRIRKEFVAGKKSILVKYSIINESGETRQVAPWEISRVPGDGLIFFDCPVEGITPAGLMPFEEKFGLSWFAYNTSEKQRKINADGKGWLAFANNGLVLIKKFADIAPDAPAPGEAEIQVYVNEGKTFIELESQGAYTTLQPGESLDWSVEWFLVPFKGDPVPSKALAKAVKKAVK